MAACLQHIPCHTLDPRTENRVVTQIRQAILDTYPCFSHRTQSRRLLIHDRGTHPQFSSLQYPPGSSYRQLSLFPSSNGFFLKSSNMAFATSDVNIVRTSSLRCLHASTPLTTRISPIFRAFFTSSDVLGMRSCSSSVKTLSRVAVDGGAADGLCLARRRTRW